MEKIAVITGGAQGIGLAIVKELILNNVKCIVLDKNEVELNKLKEQFPVVDIICIDIGQIKLLQQLLDLLSQQYPHIHYLVNNAAIQAVEPIDQLNFEHVTEILQVNLVAGLYLMTKLSQQMKEGDGIINISSVHAKRPRLDKYAYDASKAALNLMTQEFALALAPKKIRVNAVSPGATKTPLNHNFEDIEEYTRSVQKIPFGEVATPEQIAKVVVFYLLTDSYTTGSIITIDGGRSL
jgi:NAD(P)-dependent dehydrogenase (short-subunit alcohol dehydrogenase family)